jgi:uncharacterized RDD family membrane protein YckC
MSQHPELPWHNQGETLVVETPEQIRLELRIAPFGSRMLAALLDRMVITAVTVAIAIVAYVAVGGAPVRTGAGIVVAGVIVCYFLTSVFYFVVAELRGEGRTWGKRAVGLRTIHESGRGLTPASSLIRNLARMVDEIPLAWFVPALTEGRRRIGDLLAGTFVIEERRENVRREDWIARLAGSYAELEEKRFPLPPTAIARLDPEDLNLIEYLGERLPAATGDRRRLMLRAVARRYVARLGIEERGEEIDADSGRFLQELGLLLRQRFDRVER